MTDSREFIFKKSPQGILRFVGDFDGYYRTEADPWGQSGTEESTEPYYRKSRERTLALLETTNTSELLIVGCGIGYTMTNYRGNKPTKIVGIDLSREAVKKAKTSFPEFSFYEADITKTETLAAVGNARFDTIIFEQILWYILEDIRSAFQNALGLLQPKGSIIVSNAFLREQGYGKEIIDGYAGAVKYFSDLPGLRLVQSQHYDEGLSQTDGHFLLGCE